MKMGSNQKEIEFGKRILDFDSPYDPAPGMLLVANPFMLDPNFRRTVVLLVEHNEEGSLGYVLNRPLELNLHRLIPGLMELPFYVGYGGPVQLDTLHFIHTRASLEGKEIMKNVYYGGNFEILQSLIENGLIEPNELKFFVGYSGWGSGQLEEEIEEKAWIVWPPNPSLIFQKDVSRLWEQVLSQRGIIGKVQSRFPLKPWLN